jgi:hypothetical protein
VGNPVDRVEESSVSFANVTCEVSNQFADGSDIEEKIYWCVDDNFEKFGVQISSHSASEPD